MSSLLYDFVRIGPAISEESRATDGRTDARTDGRTDISSFMIPLWGLKTQWGITSKLDKVHVKMPCARKVLSETE